MVSSEPWWLRSYNKNSAIIIIFQKFERSKMQKNDVGRWNVLTILLKSDRLRVWIGIFLGKRAWTQFCCDLWALVTCHLYFFFYISYVFQVLGSAVYDADLAKYGPLGSHTHFDAQTSVWTNRTPHLGRKLNYSDDSNRSILLLEASKYFLRHLFASTFVVKTLSSTKL